MLGPAGDKMATASNALIEKDKNVYALSRDEHEY